MLRFQQMIMRGLDAPPATSPSQGSVLQEKTNVGSSPHARFAKGSTPVAKSANTFEKKDVRSVDIVEAREKEEVRRHIPTQIQTNHPHTLTTP